MGNIEELITILSLEKDPKKQMEILVELVNYLIVCCGYKEAAIDDLLSELARYQGSKT